MKTSTKLVYAMMLAGMITGQADAKDVYVASDGNDSNSGLSASEPRATLTSLNDILEEGDVINVSGILDMTKEMALTDGQTDWKQTWGHWFTNTNGSQTGFYINGANEPANTPWRGITIQGSNPESDGFDGKDQTRLFLVRGNNKHQTVTFKNLKFMNGLCPGEGAGAIFVTDNAYVDVDNCVFTNNHHNYTNLTVDGNVLKTFNSERGGAINMQTGKLNIANSEFDGNVNRRGGAILASGGSLTVYNTRFHDNGASDLPGFEGKYMDDTKGGAICLWPLHTALNATFDHCSFNNNTVWNMGGAAFLYNNVGGGHMLDAVFTNCDFIGNRSVNGNSGAVLINNAEQAGNNDNRAKNIRVSFANCSFFENMAKQDGGAIYLWGGAKNDVVRLVNCTIANNSTEGNAGHGGGYAERVCTSGGGNFTPDDVDRYIYNCLFEYNQAPNAADGQGEYSDIMTAFGYINMDYCHVGRIVSIGISQEDFIASLNNGEGAVRLTANTSNEKFGDELNTFVIPEDNLNYYQYSQGCLPFIALNEGHELLSAGNREYLVLSPSTFTTPGGTVKNLSGFDITASDQAGFNRPENTCAIGAVEATMEQLLDDSDGPSYFEGKDLPYISGEQPGFSGIVSIVEDVALTVDYSDNILTSQGATIEVFNISGMKLLSGIDSVDVNKLASGIYIAKIVNGGKVKSLKVTR